MANKYDVVIIGAGIGGLTAGLVLAKSGKKVLILEKNNIAGGYASYFKRDDFEFNVSLGLLNDCKKAGLLYNILEKYSVPSEWDFIMPKYLYRSVWPDYDFHMPQINIKSYIEILNKYFPNEKKGIRMLFKTMHNIYMHLKEAAPSKHFPSVLLRYLDATLADMLDEFLKENKLKAIISQMSLLMGLSPGRISSLYYSHALIEHIYNGCHHLKGGGRFMLNNLVADIKKNGGKVLLNKEVKRLFVKNNKVEKVITGAGEEFLAGAVISNMDALATFHNLIGDNKLPKQFLRRLDRMTPSVSAFMVFLGLKCDLKDKGIKDYIIFINPDFNLEDQYKAALKNDLVNTELLLTLCTNAASGYAPKGKFAMSIFSLAEYNFWKSLTKNEYKKKKEELSNILIKRAEKIIPGLSELIEVKSIATPLTMERYTGNSKGAVHGWDHIPSQCTFWRLKQDTPVDNLYLAGAWTYPGTGIPQVMYSGMNAANQILKNNG